MAFDPFLPANHTKIVAAELRGQFNGLLDLIQAAPAGPEGPTGPPGTSVAGAVVDSVTTLDPGSPAEATASFDGTAVHFTLSIPRGDTGAEGVVTSEQFDTAIIGTAVNPANVAALGLTISDPPTQAELQAVSDKVDELLAVLRRV